MKVWLFIKTFLCSLLLVGCSSLSDSTPSTQQWMQPNGKIKVLTTTAMIHDIVKEIGGDFVDTCTLIKGELDPHSYQLVKGDDEKLAFADIVFFNGLGLEHSPSLHHFLEKSKKAVPLGNRIMENEPTLLLYNQGQPDPHIWMDISLWAKTIPHIVNTLASLDPQHLDYYQERGKKLREEMLHAHEHAQHTLQGIPSSKRYLVTSHDAFNYFTRAYLTIPGEGAQALEERFAAPEGLAPESQISSTDIQFILNHLKKYQIHVIFSESNVNQDSLRKIVDAAKSKGMDVRIAKTPLYADAMGPPGSDGDSYLKMIKHDVQALKDNLDD